MWDASEDMLNDNTFRFLLQQAREGRVRGIVGGPSDRTFSVARYLAEDHRARTEAHPAPRREHWRARGAGHVMPREGAAEHR